MAIKIEGKGRVWAKEHEGWTAYTIGISNKNQDGTWINAYQDEMAIPDDKGYTALTNDDIPF